MRRDAGIATGCPDGRTRWNGDALSVAHKPFNARRVTSYLYIYIPDQVHLDEISIGATRRGSYPVYMPAISRR